MGGDAFKRLASYAIVAGGWLIAGVRTALDLIGWSTAPDDVAVAESRLDQILIWLLSLPLWLPWGFALIATLWLMWVSWPRDKLPRTQDQSIADLAQECLSLSREILNSDPKSRPYEHFRALIVPVFHQLWRYRIAFPIYDSDKNDEENAVSAAKFLAAIGQYLKYDNVEEAKRFADETIKRAILKRQSQINTAEETPP